MRYSRQRELILNIVKGRCDHPTADDIYNEAKLKEPSISLGTVYRDLKNLTDSGEIITLETTDKKIHYDGNTVNHAHFICVKCGKIIDLGVYNYDKTQIEGKGLKLLKEKCVYYGYCEKCK